MDLNRMMKEIKSRPDFDKAGMVLAHNGVVRGTSRDGKKVSGLTVKVDHEKLAEVLEEKKKYPGILDILVDIAEDTPLGVGDDVMYIVVAGDIREHVLDCLTDTLNAIKSTVTSKTEMMV